MRKKKKMNCCDGGCFSGKGYRDDWSSSDLEYEKDYEKLGREYEKEYARLCELQRSLTPEERSKRSETSGLDEASSSRTFISEIHEISEEPPLRRPPRRKVHFQEDDEDEYDSELLEKLMKEAEEAEMLNRRRKEKEVNEEERLRRNAEEEARRKREEEEEMDRRNREEVARREKQEKEAERKRREEAARTEREEEIYRKRREDLAIREREEEEIRRRRRVELARRREQEELARQKEAIARREREEDVERRRREEEALQREKEELERRQQEEIARRKMEAEIAREKKEEEEIARREREELLRREREEEEMRRQHEEILKRVMEEEDIRRQKEESLKREREEEDMRRQREEQARKEQEEMDRKKSEDLARKELEIEEQQGLMRVREGLVTTEMTGEGEAEKHTSAGVDQTPPAADEEHGEAFENGDSSQIQQESPSVMLNQQGKNLTTGVSFNIERGDRIQRSESDRYDTYRGATARSGENGNGDIRERSVSFRDVGKRTDWILEESLDEHENEDEKLIRSQSPGRNDALVEDSNDEATSSSAASDDRSEDWDSWKSNDTSVSPSASLQLGVEFLNSFQRKREELFGNAEEHVSGAGNAAKSKSQYHLQIAGSLIYGTLGLTLLISLFIVHLSLIAKVRAPAQCVDEKIILDFSARRIRLRGGRYVSFREQGVEADKAQHSVVVVHDLLSSRLAGIPGIRSSLLEEYKVRLVMYDRPGYGQSDPHPGRDYKTSAHDIMEIADALNLGEKFWVMGFGGGGPHVWAAINYIPERLAGVALFAPAGSPYVGRMNKREIEETWSTFTPQLKWMHFVARRFPTLLPRFLQRTAVTSGPSVSKDVIMSLGPKDQQWMEQLHIEKAWQEDVKEALRHGCAFPLAEEVLLLVKNWGFRLSSLPLREQKTFNDKIASLFGREKKPKFYEGPIHIWQGTDDQVVPVAVNNAAKRDVEQGLTGLSLSRKSSRVKLHYLPGESHFSWFWYCDECHRRIFKTLFRPVPGGEEQDEKQPEEQPPLNSGSLTDDDYDAIVKAYAALEASPVTSNVGKDAAVTTSTPSADVSSREELLRKVLLRVLRHNKGEGKYPEQPSTASRSSSKTGSSGKDKAADERQGVNPMTCRVTSEGGKSSSYMCPDDEGTEKARDLKRDSSPSSKSGLAKDTQEEGKDSLGSFEGLFSLIRGLTWNGR